MQSSQWGVEKLNDIFRSKPVILVPTSRDFWWRLNVLMHMNTVGIVLGKSHGQRSLVGCSPWGCWESDTTERRHFDFSLSCIGEGNGNPLLCSCLENPKDWGAWWVAVYGVAQSRTWLKWLSSSSSRQYNRKNRNWSPKDKWEKIARRHILGKTRIKNQRL